MASRLRTTFSNLRGWRGGVVITAIGTLVLGLGLLRTTSSTQVDSCPVGSVLIAKFEWKGNKYVFEKPPGNQNIVTISDANTKGGKWTSTKPIAHVMIKGGPNTVIKTYNPPQTSGTFENDELPKVGKGNRPDISNVQFCGPKHPPTTTTTSTTTTSTTTSTTTTSTTTTSTTTTSTTTTSTTTTTTQPPASTTTSTTQPSETTTTSTTEPPATTTTSTTSTTVVGPTTTDDDPGATTTPPTTTTTPPTTPTIEVLVLSDTEVLSQTPGGTTRLPRTGSASIPLVITGVVLIGLGVTFTTVSALRARR